MRHPGGVETLEAQQGARDDLLLAAWLDRDLPLRDYLLGSVFSTTTRCLLYGETGVGKTLFAMDMGAAMAAGQPFLGWSGHRQARIMYLDGELPAETFKERMELIAETYGPDLPFYGYNREVIGPDEMPPLNTGPGRNWLWREIETVQPDAIFFDSIMCLLMGSMSEEESWAPVKGLLRAISARRIAQIWMHHTGHDGSRSFGTKTREWEMDTVIAITKSGEEDDVCPPVQIEFKKARLRTPASASQFATRTVRRADGGWCTEGFGHSVRERSLTDVELMSRAILEAYDRLADGASISDGFNGAPVRRVNLDAIRCELRSRGFLDVNEKGHITATARTQFNRAKQRLLASGKLIEQEATVWRP